MASSKTLLLLVCLLFALVLMLSSEVAADHTKESKNSNGIEEGKYGGYPGNGGYNNGGNGGGNRGYPPGRSRCDYGCCRGYRYSNGCRRCCAHANEAPDAQFEDDVKN